MAQVVRKIHGDLVEVLYDRALDPSSGPAKSLIDFAAGQPEMEILRDAEGHVTGVQAPARVYVAFLQSINVSKTAIAQFRAALDDSKKAVRARQREPRRS